MLNDVPKFVKQVKSGDNIYYQYFYKGWFYTFPLNMKELNEYGTINITKEINKFQEDIDKLLIEMKDKNYQQLRFSDYGI